MHLKLLGNLFPQSPGEQRTEYTKSNFIPSNIGQAPAAKGLSNHVLSHLVYTKAQHQTEQPACKLLPFPQWAARHESKRTQFFSQPVSDFMASMVPFAKGNTALFVWSLNLKILIIEEKNRGNFSPRGWWHIGIGYPRRLWMTHPWRHSRSGWMWIWAAWSGSWQPCT